MASKDKYNPTYKYNRQTKGFRRIQAQTKMKELGVKSPKQKHVKLIIRGSIALFILWIPFAIFCTVKLGIPGLLGAFALAVLYVFILARYFASYQRKLVYTYMDLGIPKAVYMNEMSKRRRDPKALRKLEKAWDSAEKKYNKKAKIKKVRQKTHE